MKKTITLSVAHPALPQGLIQGFQFLWAYYVGGFRPEFHCQDCFSGRLVAEFCTGRAESGRAYELDAMDRFGYVYVCGVSSGPRASRGVRNLHLPLRYEAGESVTAGTYNGYVITAENAVALPIPALPAGWKGRDLATTRCKNFQFAVEYFGYPAGGGGEG